jgi:SAM-dependent methyltransferase
MALNREHVALLCALRDNGIIGPGRTRSVLEMGEQNWFGDVDPAELHSLLEQLAVDDPAAPELRRRLSQLQAAPRTGDGLFDLAKLFYRLIFGAHAYRAVDLHGTAIAEKHDLNLPLPFSDQFDVVTNLGTAEHIFNQYQVFKSIHEKTLPGGIMIHSLPHQGCYDHGFFNYHPTFLFDLSHANRYEIVLCLYCDDSVTPSALIPLRDRAAYVSLALEKKISNYCGLIAVLRRPSDDAPFATPWQGYYDNQLPPELAAAWSRLPR